METLTGNLGLYFLCGSLGVLLNICVKINSMKNSSKAANHTFNIKDYFKDDIFTIIGSFTSVLILMFCIDELLPMKPELAKYIKWFFVFVGYTGSSLVQAAFSVYAKKITSIIDVKTNIADGIKPPVDSGNIQGAVEIQKDKAELKKSSIS